MKKISIFLVIFFILTGCSFQQKNEKLVYEISGTYQLNEATNVLEINLPRIQKGVIPDKIQISEINSKKMVWNIDEVIFKKIRFNKFRSIVGTWESTYYTLIFNSKGGIIFRMYEK